MRLLDTTGLCLVIVAMALSGCEGVPTMQKELWPTPPAPAPKTPEAEPRPKPAPKIEAPALKVEAPPAPTRSPQLLAGITAYDNGHHREAATLLRKALPRLSRVEQVEAHKYLAFIECSLDRKSQCRDEFKKALSLDPSFDLTPAEVGHPVWGPIFRSVKGSPRR